MVKKLLVYRNWSGVGDWIMAMTVLKMVNRQYPDIDIYLNVMAKNRFTAGSGYEMIPPLVQEVVKEFDVKINGFVQMPKHRAYTLHFDYISGHMGYEKNGKNFIEGMVDQFNIRTGLELEYEPDVFAQYQGEGTEYDNTTDSLKPYVLIQSCSKMRSRGRQGKDYGYDNMCEIAERVGAHVNMIQIGQLTDYRIPNIEAVLGGDLSTLHKLMVNSIGFIGMDGGLGVYASHHGVKQFIIYEEARRFSWTNFPHREQIDGDLGTENISEIIISDLLMEEDRNEKAVWQNTCKAGREGL